MTHLILMLVAAAAMVLFREPFGRALVRAVGAIDGRWVVILALLAFCVWGILHHVQAPMNLTGDALSGLFDTFAYGDILFTYADLVVGAALLLLNRQTRELLGRVAGLARAAVRRTIRRAGRRPARRRRGAPDRDDPEPGALDGVLGFA